MKNIEIKVSKTSRMVYLKNGNIGNDGENLQEKLIFSFQDKFVDGQARLEYEIGGEKYFAILTKVGESYELPIKNVITKEGQVNMQLVITEGTDENEIPVFKSNVFYVFVNKSINAETEEPDGYAQWLDIANTKLNSIDEAILGVQEAVDYAKEQGDYAKEQAENVISANEEASEIIRDFEDDVEEYTSAFNQNAENKVSEYNTNATNKVTEYNDNATEKLNAYNTNANNKVGEYNVNADNRINDFNQNADSYLDAIVPKNEASGVPIYVDDALPYKVFNYGAKGNYEQETTTGINLLNPDGASTTRAGITVTNNGDGTFTINGTATANVSIPLTVGSVGEELTGEQAYTLAMDIISNGGSSGSLTGAINKNETVQYNFYSIMPAQETGMKVQVSTPSENATLREINYYVASGGVINNLTIRVYLVKGNYTKTTIPSFEPYTGGQASPNPDYPQEIEVLEGYNLLPFTNQDFTFKGVHYYVQNGSLYLDGTSVDETTTASQEFKDNFSFVLPAGTYYFDRGNFTEGTYLKKYSDNSNLITNQGSFVLKEDTQVYVGMYIYQKVFDNQKLKLQLVKGIAQKIYLPYQNVGYRSVGKNKLNVPSEYTITGSKTHNINIPAGSYIISWEDIITDGTEQNMLMYFYYEDGTTLTRYISPTYTSKTLNFTATKNVNKVNIYSQSGYNASQNVTTTFKKLMISTEGGEYEPHQELIVPIDLKGNFVGKLSNEVADRLLYKDRHIYLEKNVGKVVFDGSENWQDWNAGGGYFGALVDDLIQYNNSNGTDIRGITNYFRVTANSPVLSNTQGLGLRQVGDATKRIYCAIDNTIINSLADFKTWLSEHKPEFYYQLATPELIDLGEYDLSTLQGTNNISLLANLEPSDMNMTYALDIKKYIDKKVQ